jgi:1,2-diacylglycerol 3-alpha-glucosyltransferase
MKIGMFSDSYLPYASGVVRSVETSTKELRRLGDQVFIVAPKYPGFVDRDEHILRFPSYRFSHDSDFRLALPYNRELVRDIRRMGLDVIHSHSPFLLGRLATSIGRALGVPVVFTHHTLYGEYGHYVKWLPRPITKHIVNRYVVDYCQRANLVIAPTLAIGNLLVGLGIDRPVEILETGVDLQEFAGEQPIDIRERYGLSQEHFVLLFVGRLGREKNLTTLIEATAPILKSRAEMRLVLAGDGPERGALEELARRRGIAEKTIFTGVLDRREVVSAYKASDLFVFSSLTETQGLVISEALAASLPVVAVRAFGVEQMVRDGVDGLLTQPAAEELSRAILRLVDNRHLLKTFSNNAAAGQHEKSATTMARRLKEIYRRVTAGGEPTEILREAP